jgi:tetratricopeptide (TPR) repeat protein
MSTPTFPLLGLLTVSALAFGAVEPAPASINVKDRPPIEGSFVESETIDKLVYVLGNPKDPRSAKSEMGHDKYLSVTYTAGEDGNYLAGEVAYDKGEWDKAAEFLKKSLASAKWSWEIESAYLKIADSYTRLNKSDDALAILKEFGDKFPRTVHQAELVSRRGQLKLLKGDFAGADADFAEMVKHGDEWTATTLREGMLGRRNVLRAAKKYAEAAALLAPYFAKLNPDSQAEDVGTVGLALADDLEAAGKADEALAMCKKLYLSALGTEPQCRAHLKTARLLAAANTTANNLAAFDHAALAATLGADNDTQFAAAKLARELVTQRIDKDKTVSDDDRKEYRIYANSL